jgi:hypothetical protein
MPLQDGLCTSFTGTQLIFKPRWGRALAPGKWLNMSSSVAANTARPPGQGTRPTGPVN